MIEAITIEDYQYTAVLTLNFDRDLCEVKSDITQVLSICAEFHEH